MLPASAPGGPYRAGKVASLFMSVLEEAAARAYQNVEGRLGASQIQAPWVSYEIDAGQPWGPALVRNSEDVIDTHRVRWDKNSDIPFSCGCFAPYTGGMLLWHPSYGPQWLGLDCQLKLDVHGRSHFHVMRRSNYVTPREAARLLPQMKAILWRNNHQPLLVASFQDSHLMKDDVMDLLFKLEYWKVQEGEYRLQVQVDLVVPAVLDNHIVVPRQILTRARNLIKSFGFAPSEDYGEPELLANELFNGEQMVRVEAHWGTRNGELVTPFVVKHFIKYFGRDFPETRDPRDSLPAGRFMSRTDGGEFLAGKFRAQRPGRHHRIYLTQIPPALRTDDLMKKLNSAEGFRTRSAQRGHFAVRRVPGATVEDAVLSLERDNRRVVEPYYVARVAFAHGLFEPGLKELFGEHLLLVFPVDIDRVVEEPTEAQLLIEAAREKQEAEGDDRPKRPLWRPPKQWRYGG